MVADTYHNNPFMRRRIDAERKKQPAPPAKWACNCDSKQFLLLEGGEIECASCGTIQNLRHFDPRVPVTP